MTSTSAPNFDRVARIYRWAEYAALGPMLQRTRTRFLADLKSPTRVFALGDGDGRFLQQLLLRYPGCTALAVDSSAAMLRLLEQRCLMSVPNAASRLETHHASALDVTPPPGTDLVVTHFFLDCLAQDAVDALASNIAASLKRGALWLVSDFALPSRPVLRLPARAYIAGLYAAFRVLTGLRVCQLPDSAASLHQAGFRRLQRDTILGGLLYTELWRRE